MIETNVLLSLLQYIRPKVINLSLLRVTSRDIYRPEWVERNSTQSQYPCFNRITNKQICAQIIDIGSYLRQCTHSKDIFSIIYYQSIYRFFFYFFIFILFCWSFLILCHMFLRNWGKTQYDISCRKSVVAWLGKYPNFTENHRYLPYTALK